MEQRSANARKDVLGYHYFLEVSGSLLHHLPNMIKSSEWGQDRNCTSIAFNSVPNGDADTPFHRNAKRSRSLQLEIALSKNITVLVWGKFENVFQIDDKRGILYNVHR